MPDSLYESVNPLGNLQAVVEEDDRVVYFYLFGGPDSDFGMRAVWVRNLVSAPYELDVAEMKEGVPPKQPAAATRHPDGAASPDRERLRVVWLPEGNGAALYDGTDLLAIIPPWSGMNGFYGYARDAIGEGPLAWELRKDNVLFERFDAAARYWSLWDDENLWGNFSERMMRSIESTLGSHRNYYAIDGNKWPPKTMLRFEASDRISLVTLGISLLPQPNVEMSTENPELLRRMELGVVLPSTWSDSTVKRFGAYISGQSTLPWSKWTWLGHGHMIPCDSWQNPKFTATILTKTHPGAPALDLGQEFGDPVNLVWFLPITEAERSLAMEKGSHVLLAQLPPDRWREA